MVWVAWMYHEDCQVRKRIPASTELLRRPLLPGLGQPGESLGNNGTLALFKLNINWLYVIYFVIAQYL